MCGILALFYNQSLPKDAIERGMNSLKSRGPDGRGDFENEGIYLGHQRLAIIDLDERAKQPMTSICNRFVIIFNGEIYNYKEIKSDLEKVGYIFKTTSDTEVLLALFSLYGEKMLDKLQGMFAFIIWDKINSKAFVARDPYGIKPLYFSFFNNGVIFSSQVGSIISTKLTKFTPSLNGQSGFWLLGSVPEPFTWYEEITSLLPGHYLWIKDCKIIEQVQWADISTFWNNSSLKFRKKISYDQMQKNVRNILIESVKRHIISDVPIGVFLSGGIDSGALAALMKECGSDNLIGITISFDEFNNSKRDESVNAKLIANKYGIKHHIRNVSKDEFNSDLPKIIAAMDQPSIDGINTWYASKAVAELGLKVVVSGVGGDELFLGYPSFNTLPLYVSIWRILIRVPGIFFVAKIFSKILAKVKKNNRWEFLPYWLKSIQGAWMLNRSVNSPNVIKSKFPNSDFANYANFVNILNKMCGYVSKDLTLGLAQIESTTYLRNQLLRDSDWASMSHGIELRTPFVDYTLLKNLNNYLYNFKYYNNKILLANSPILNLPIEVTFAKKTGFGIPIKQWISSESISNTDFNDLWMNMITKMYEEKNLF